MGVYRPATGSGVVHVADHQDMPGKKIWSWGWDDEGRDWRRALSDDESAYLEVQAGLFRNQETYAFLEPEQVLRFRESYQPVRKIGGWSRANDAGVLHLRREATGALRVGINLTRSLRSGRIVVRDGATSVRAEPFSLTPAGAFDRSFPDLTAKGPYTVEIRDAQGRVLLAHTENGYDFVSRSDVKTGPQAPYVFPPAERRSEGDWLELGRHQELNGKRLEAHDAYDAALAALPRQRGAPPGGGPPRGRPQALRRGRPAPVARRRAREQRRRVPLLPGPRRGVPWRRPRRPASPGTRRRPFPAVRPASLLHLAALAAREGDLTALGLQLVREALADSPQRPRRGHGGGPAAATRAQAGGADTAPSLARRGPGELAAAARRDPARRPRPVALGAPRLGPRAGAGSGRRLHGDRPLGRRACAPRASLSVRRHGLRARGGPAAGLPARRLLPRLLRGAPRPLRARGLRARLAPVDPLRLSEPARVDARPAPRARSESERRDGALPARLALPRGRPGGRSPRRVGEGAGPRPADPRAPSQRRPDAALLAPRRRQGRAAGVRGRHERRPDERRALPGRRPGAEPAGTRRRRADRRAPALSRHPAALDARLQAVARSFGSLSLRRSGGPLPRPFLPARGVRDERAAGVPRGQAARGDGRRQGRAQGQGAGARGGARPARVGVRLHEGRDEAVRGRAALPVLPRRAAAESGDDAAAREHWRRATAGRDLRQAAFAYRAAQRLGEASDAEWRPRLEAALAEADTYLFRGGHYPALATLGRGLLLRALGRTAEGDEALRQVFTLPDKGMPHHMARLALEER